MNNGGQGGYQADQIVLLAEQLLPLIHPQVIVVDLIPGTIIGTGYASSGWPKPYFTVENGELVDRTIRRFRKAQAASSDRLDIKRYLRSFRRRSISFMAAFFADFWFTADGSSFLTVATDEIGVTCRLLARLKQKTDAADVRLLLYLQYGGLEIVDSKSDGGDLGQAGSIIVTRWIKNKLKSAVAQHAARRAGLVRSRAERSAPAHAASESRPSMSLPVLRAVYDRNPDDLRKYYQIEPDGSMGHKSSFGNMEVAKLVAAAIGEVHLPADQKSK